MAEHYFLSESYLKSAEYSRLASRKAEKSASYNDAIAYTKKRVTSLERLPKVEDIEKQIIDARAVLGLYLTSINHFYEIKEVIEPIINLATRSNYRKRLCSIYTVLATYYLFVEENSTEAFKNLESALKISEEIKDYGVSFVYAQYWFGIASAWKCDFEKSAKYLQMALDMQTAANILWAISGTKSSLAYFPYYLNGKIDLQFKTSNEAVHIAEESGDIWPKAISYVAHGVSLYARGLLEEAERHLLKGLEFCEKINFPVWEVVAQYHLGEIYFARRDFSHSKEFYKKGVCVLENHHLFPSSWVVVGKVGWARSKIMNKEKGTNLESLFNYSHNNKGKIFEGWIQRYIGEILLNIDDQHVSEAENWIEKAIEADQRNGMMFNLGQDYSLHADLFKRKGDRLRVQENLGKAIEILKECGADGWVEKYEKELASL